MKSEAAESLHDLDLEALDLLWLSREWPTVWEQVKRWERGMTWAESNLGSGAQWSIARRMYQTYVQQALDFCAKTKKPDMSETIH